MERNNKMEKSELKPQTQVSDSKEVLPGIFSPKELLFLRLTIDAYMGKEDTAAGVDAESLREAQEQTNCL